MAAFRPELRYDGDEVVKTLEQFKETYGDGGAAP
eukprot:gene4503-4518_t